MTDEPQDKVPARRRRGPRKATARTLENAALAHLARFACSRENLRRVLMRRVERSARHHATDRDQGRRLVDEIVTRLARSGLLDDRAYAEGRARSLAARGVSPRHLRARLLAQGVDAATMDAVLALLAGETSAPELAAALRLARRRRLGPYRAAGARAAFRERDLAALARAGLAYDVAPRVVDAADGPAIEAEISV